MLARLFPCPHDDLWHLNEYAHLTDDCCLDLCGGDAADGARLRPPFDHTCGDVIAIQSLAAARVCGREGETVGAEQEPLERRHAILAARVGGTLAGALLQDRVDLVP